MVLVGIVAAIAFVADAGQHALSRFDKNVSPHCSGDYGISGTPCAVDPAAGRRRDRRARDGVRSATKFPAQSAACCGCWQWPSRTTNLSETFFSSSWAAPTPGASCCKSSSSTAKGAACWRAKADWLIASRSSRSDSDLGWRGLDAKIGHTGLVGTPACHLDSERARFIVNFRYFDAHAGVVPKL